MKAVKTDRTCSYNIREKWRHVEYLCEYLQVSGGLGEGLCTDILTSGSYNESAAHDQTYTVPNIKLMSIELDTACSEAVVA
jgi:hypothetical protein